MRPQHHCSRSGAPRPSEPKGRQGLALISRTQDQDIEDGTALFLLQELFDVQLKSSCGSFKQAADRQLRSPLRDAVHAGNWSFWSRPASLLPDGV